MASNPFRGIKDPRQWSRREIRCQHGIGDISVHCHNGSQVRRFAISEDGVEVVRSDWTAFDTPGLGLRAHEGICFKIPRTFSERSDTKLFPEAINGNGAHWPRLSSH